MKKVAIIQARMGSTRLPGKVLKRVLNKPLLEYQLERVANAKELDEYLVATTIRRQDDPIAEWCESRGITVFRGDEEDVLARYYKAAEDTQADVIIRLTADCPFIDPQIMDRVIQVYMANPDRYDYVSNVIKRTFPRGMDVEVFSRAALTKCFMRATKRLDREHVTRYIYQRPNEFRLFNVEYEQDESKHRWTIDTREDFQFAQKLIEQYYQKQPKASLADLLELTSQNPDWQKVNQYIKQKDS